MTSDEVHQWKLDAFRVPRRVESARCSCDDHCDDPCPVHARENALQDQVIELRNLVEALRSGLQASEAARDVARAEIATHMCTECGWWTCHGHEYGCSKDSGKSVVERGTRTAAKPHPWRMVCHNCGERYPINGAGARDCCAAPNLRLHDLSEPCDWCDDTV